MVWAYYITCLMSGIAELGSVFWGIKYGFSIPQILGMALAYQLGNILRFFATPKIAKLQNVICIFVCITSVSLWLLDKDSLFGYAATFLMFMLYSTILQNIRSAVQGNIPRWRKRSCRVLGFTASAIVYINPMIIFFILSLALLYFSIKLPKFSYDQWLINWKNGKYGPKVAWAMVTHQAHYFAYNYILVVLTMMYFQNSLVTTLWFAGNWIPYTITEPLVKKLNWNKWYFIAISAHIFNSVILLGMFFGYGYNIYITVGLWVLTGFGGGNVFCIKKALEKKVKYEKSVWSFSEQIGHICGVLSALILSLVSDKVEYSMIVAVVFALLTVPIIIGTLREEQSS